MLKIIFNVSAVYKQSSFYTIKGYITLNYKKYIYLENLPYGNVWSTGLNEIVSGTNNIIYPLPIFILKSLIENVIFLKGNKDQQ